MDQASGKATDLNAILRGYLRAALDTASLRSAPMGAPSRRPSLFDVKIPAEQVWRSLSESGFSLIRR